MSEVQYLTADGAERLRNELDYLKGPGREQLAKRLRAAIQMGDLSENADYSSAKEDQAFMEGRIAELESILRNFVIIDDTERPLNVVNIGHKVTIQEEDFPEETYHIVGPKEADPRKGMISHASPIGEALIGHSIGDEVSVKTPGGNVILKILKIE